MDFIVSRIYGPGFLEGALSEAKTRPDINEWKYTRDERGEVKVYSNPNDGLREMQAQENIERNAFIRNKDEQGNRDPEPCTIHARRRSITQDEYSSDDGRLLIYSVRMVSDKGLDKSITWELRRF